MWLFSKLQKTSNNTCSSLTRCENGNEWWASFEFYPLAVGSRKSVFEGRMYIPDNYWSQKEAVVKAVNIGQGDEGDMKAEVRAAIVAEEYAKRFSQHVATSKQEMLKFIRPVAAVLECVSVFNGLFRVMKGYNKVLVEGEVVIIEELIEGDFVNFIRKNGVVSNSCSDFLQAYCHYTYSRSGGQLVVCGLQGTLKSNTYTLTTPTIHSRGKQFGKTDGGEIGIHTFFSHHTCNALCKDLPLFSNICEVKSSAPELDSKIFQELSKSLAGEKTVDEDKNPQSDDLHVASVDVHPPAYDVQIRPPPYEVFPTGDSKHPNVHNYASQK